VHRNREGGDRDRRDRHQILDGVERRLGLEQRLGDVGGRAAEQQRVTVGARTRGLRCADAAASAADVLDYHSAEERLDAVGPRSAHGVECATRRKRHDQPHRAIGIARLRPCAPRQGLRSSRRHSQF
jgi:hypothetical protein